MFESVLVVCTGNICRSPMGEYLLRQHWGRAAARIASAGTAALVNHPADPDACAVMSGQGIDMAAHRARQLDAAMVAEHELILTMEPHHQRWVQQRFPTARGRVYPMTHWLPGQDPVVDPYCQGREAFEHCWTQLEPAVASWVERLG